jgi:hypothetical protein
MIGEEPISASKIVKITYQQTLGLLLSTSPRIFNYIWSYRTPIKAKFVSLER